MTNHDDSYLEVISKLEEKIPKLMAKKQVEGMSIALIRDAQIIWVKAFGLKNVEKQIKLTEETIFEVASLSKPVVSFITLKVCEEGILDLDILLTL